MDVSFYTTELPQYALIEAIPRTRAQVVQAGAAMTYTHSPSSGTARPSTLCPPHPPDR